MRIIIISLLLLAGCSSDNEQVYPMVDKTIYPVCYGTKVTSLNIEGHTYLILSVDSQGSTSIVHAEHCKCRK